MHLKPKVAVSILLYCGDVTFTECKDNAEALVPIDVLRGKKNGPFNNNNNSNIYLKPNIQCI